MDEVIRVKLNELIDLFDNNKIINDFDMIKKEIIDDNDIKNLISSFNNTKDHNEMLNIKHTLSQNDSYNEYKRLEREIYYLVLEINNRLNSLTNKKNCHK